MPVFLRRVQATCLLVVLLAGATAALAAPLTTAFTYQGRLADAGQPVTGTYDITFRLFDALSGGAQVGPTVVATGVVVTQGVFTVTLDFGPVSWAQARWLEVTVGTTTLSPRQPVTPTPAALHAASAASAPFSGLTGVPSGLADGDDVGLTSVPWSIVQNRPAGLDDGDNDTTYTAGTGLALTGTTFSAKGTPLANIVTVAKSGGNFTSIQAAIDSITTAGASTPWLVYVAPGSYEERVVLKDYVSLQGAGREMTTISAPSGGVATITGAHKTTVSNLTVWTDAAAASRAVGYYLQAGDASLSAVTIVVRNASTAVAVDARGDWLDVRDSLLQANAESGQAAVGLDHFQGTVHLRGSEISVTASNGGAQGILSSGYQVHMEGGSISAFASFAGGGDVQGAQLWTGTLRMTGVRVMTGGGRQAFGLLTESTQATVVVIDGDVQASGGSLPSTGISGIGFFQVRGSRISASVAAQASVTEFRIAHTMLDGTVVAPVTCIGAYGASYAARTCP